MSARSAIHPVSYLSADDTYTPPSRSTGEAWASSLRIPHDKTQLRAECRQAENLRIDFETVHGGARGRPLQQGHFTRSPQVRALIAQE